MTNELWATLIGGACNGDEFKEPNSSHNYKLVCNTFFGQSRFIDMGYGY